MKFNSLTSLLVSTFLVSTAASAGKPGELSDALNGIDVPEKDRKEHVQKIKNRLLEKAKVKGQVLEQVKRVFFDLALEGDDHDRVKTKAIIDVLKDDFNTAKYRQEMYDSYDEKGLPPSLSSRNSFSGKLTSKVRVSHRHGA